MGGLIANGHSEESISYELAESRNRHIPRFRTHIDDYIQFSPLTVAYSLDAFGVRSKTDALNRTASIGYLSMKVAYRTHQYKWGKRKVSAKPVY